MPRPPASRRGDGSDQPHKVLHVDDSRMMALENAINEIRGILDIQFKRIAAMQAELDHLTAKKHST
jgi:hypothetical protein